MLFAPELLAQLAEERIDRKLATAELLRRARQPAPSIRQAIGRRILQIGARLAAEPSLESVRFR